MQKELSITEINNSVNSIIEQVSQNDNKGLRYEIYTLNPSLSANEQRYATGDNKGDLSCTKQIKSIIETLLNNNNIVKIRVVLKTLNGRVINESELVIKPTYGSSPVFYAPQKIDSKPIEPTPQNVSQNNANPNMNLYNILTLMGFDASKLNGVDDPINGLGAIMDIREKQIEKRYEDREKQNRYEQLIVEKAKVEEKYEELAKQYQALEKENDKLNDKIDELEEDIEELEKLKPENSLAGVSIVGALTNVAENMLRRHAGTVGKLLGTDKETMLGMLDSDNHAEQPQEIVENVEVKPLNERQAQIDVINNLLLHLDDNHYNCFVKLFEAFQANNDSILQCYRWAFGEQ